MVCGNAKLIHNDKDPTPIILKLFIVNLEIIKRWNLKLKTNVMPRYPNI